FFFFFSSRRRHTILQGDWSSDVCSSDLEDPDRSGIAGRSGSPVSFDPGSIRILTAKHIPTRAIPAPLTTVRPSRSLGLPVNRPRSEERRVGNERRYRQCGGHEKEKIRRK